jgi:putative flippase GtrA
VSRREVGRFAVVGAAAYGTDVAVFNVLRLAGTAPVGAKAVSSVLAVGVAFAGSRWWTWPDRSGPGLARQSALFVLFSALGAGLQLLCLVVSREVLGLRDAVSDNVSANVVGMALATAFRFWTFRTFVFAPDVSGRGDLRPAGGGTAAPAHDAARS